MLIELFFNNNGFVTWFRHSWKINCKVLPKLMNTRKINASDFKKLVKFMAHNWIILAEEHTADFKSWNLYLTALDYINDAAMRSSAFWDNLWISKYH